MVDFGIGRANLAAPLFAAFPNVGDSETGETNNRPCFCAGISIRNTRERLTDTIGFEKAHQSGTAS